MVSPRRPIPVITALVALFATGVDARAQTLETTLAAEAPAALARAAREAGDPRRGALLFHQAQLACARCHASGEDGTQPSLGPNLAKLGKEVDDASLVESVLFPSKAIRKGYESTTVLTRDGKAFTGRVVAEGADHVTVRDASAEGQAFTLSKADIEERKVDAVSLMPAGQVNQLSSRQDFLDLVRYLTEVRDGGPARASALQPDPAQLALVLPEYETHVDHAGLIARLDRKSLDRGEAIYTLSCANCHGTRDQAGSLPTSLRFASGRFKNGGDPFAMYQTITRGFGMMAPQTWLVPRQKYDVIHYIRETYVKPYNPSQYAGVDSTYLARLPKGDTAGPEPKLVEPWVTMDYGPSLINTYEVGSDGTNFAYKGIAVRLDPGPGGVARGHAWAVFDHDTLRIAVVWTGDRFIDWNSIAFNGRHQIHPRIVGDVMLANPSGPGWGNPETGRFDDDQRVRGRDGRSYGPLPRAWAHYRGMYHYGPYEVIAYRVGTTDVLEMPGLVGNGSAPTFTRALNLGPRVGELVLQVARHPSESARLHMLDTGGRTAPGAVLLEPSDAQGSRLVAGFSPAIAGAKWLAPRDGNLRLRIPAGAAPLRFTLWTSRVDTAMAAEAVARAVSLDDPARDLGPLTRGGPSRWPDVLTTEVVLGRDTGPFAVDSLTPPEFNPWLAQVRLTGFDFEPGGDRAAVASWDGDVWLVSGLNGLPADGTASRPARLTWRRIASGLFQPLGVKIVAGRIYVTCRDQLAILHDRNGDGAIDFVQNFNNDHQVTEHFHEFAMGLQTDDAGNFYYAKSARHALSAVVPHHGTLLRVSQDGARTDIVAQGFRAANGVCLNPDGTFYVTDQQGHWTPENRINLVKPGGFYGNMFGYHDVTDTSDEAMEKPLAWISAKMDRSPGELLWVDSPRWKGLQGELLNLSYGQGKVFLVLREVVDGQVQGGMTPLPAPGFPTGIMRGRFHPVDGQLYVCGMYAWAGDARHPGGFYRVRRTHKPLDMPIALHARKDGLELTFTDRLDPNTATDAGRYAVKTWSLRRTSDYGSPHENERPSRISSVRLADDGRTVLLAIPDIQPTWCMEIAYALKSATGLDVHGVIHNTIHKLGP